VAPKLRQQLVLHDFINIPLLGDKLTGIDFQQQQGGEFYEKTAWRQVNTG